MNINQTFELNEKEAFGIGNTSTKPSDIFKQIFTQSNVTYLLWFLAVYIIIYCLIKMFRVMGNGGGSNPGQVINVNAGTGAPSGRSSSNRGRSSARSSSSNYPMKGGDLMPNTSMKTTSMIFDFMVFAFIAIVLIVTFFSKSSDDKKRSLEKGYDAAKTYVTSPITLFSVTLFLVVFYFAIYLIGIPMGKDFKPYSISFIEIVAWIVFVIVLIVSFFKYVLNMDVNSAMDKLSNSLFKRDIKANTHASSNTYAAPAKIDTNVPKEEVFNIANNIYTYDDAADVCSIYGARLATYEDIEKSYNEGGEWCNYGWSDGQAAYFPTQKNTWDKLQKTKKSKNACGRPGVNGGFIENPNVRFGVNCYGVKPVAKTSDLDWMKAQDPTMLLNAKTPEDVFLQAKVQFWKDNANNMLKINSFNRNKWTVY